MKFRSKPPERVLEELRGLAERYKVLDFVAVDDIIDMNHVRELLPLLRDADCGLPPVLRGQSEPDAGALAGLERRRRVADPGRASRVSVLRFSA